MHRMLKYDWPGNVEELKSVIEGGVVLAKSEYLNEEELALPLKKSENGNQRLSRKHFSTDFRLEDAEKVAILKTLELAGANKSETARRLVSCQA